jgi:hypothetical protein
MSARIFQVYDCDGIESLSICDGKTLYAFPQALSDISVRSACDGSCKTEFRTKDLRQLLAKACAETMMAIEGEKILGTVVRLDKVMTAMVATSQPILGVEFASMYAKRNSRSSDFCLGNLHVHWSMSDDWNRVPKSKTCATYVMETSPCDGSCRKFTKLTRREKCLLHRQKQDRKARDAEWSAKYLKSA